MNKKILTPEEKLNKKRREIMREGKPKINRVPKPPKKYDPWRDD